MKNRMAKLDAGAQRKRRSLMGSSSRAEGIVLEHMEAAAPSMSSFDTHDEARHFQLVRDCRRRRPPRATACRWHGSICSLLIRASEHKLQRNIFSVLLERHDLWHRLHAARAHISAAQGKFSWH